MCAVKGRVLVVDDDLSLAEMLGIVLRSESLEAFFCSDGESALATFREVRPDLVLLDVMLPGKDGIDVCKEIRAESGVPIVMLTAKGDTVDVVVGLESGADDYVVKPFKPKELIARIRARIRRFDTPAQETLAIGAARRGYVQIDLEHELSTLTQSCAGALFVRLCTTARRIAASAMTHWRN